MNMSKSKPFNIYIKHFLKSSKTIQEISNNIIRTDNNIKLQ